MLKDRVNTLYGNLDYEEISGNQGAVRCFHRVEGADHAYEIVWMLEEVPTQEQFMEFAQQLSEVMNRPGNKRQRVVAANTTMLGELEQFRLGAEVGKYSWVSLINDLFHSDHFCEKVIRDYSEYAALMTERMRMLSGSERVDYRYVPQQVRSRNGAEPGSNWDEFVAGFVTSSTTPALFLVQAPAGYGKTSLSYEIAKLVAERHISNPSEPFPLFIPFAKYRRFGGVRDILRREIEELKLYGGVNSRALLQLIHDGRAIVVLDGFDELMAEMGQATAQASLAAIGEFMQAGARVLLTSRSAFLATRAEVVEMMEGRVEPEAVNVLDLVPFDGAQQRRYLEQMGLQENEVQRALEVIGKPNVHELCKSPLMLNTVAALASRGEEDQVRLGLIYGRHVDIVCEREQERQDYTLSKELQETFLAGIAKSMYSDNAYQYEPDLLELYWEMHGKDLLLSAGYAQAELEGLRTKLMCHAMFDSALSGDPLAARRGIQFVHPSFRDYFVAQEALKHLGDVGDIGGEAFVISKRSLSDDLSEILATEAAANPQCIKLLLSDNQYGVRNVLSVLNAAVRTSVLAAAEAEKLLADALGSKIIPDADISGLRLEGLQFVEWSFSGCNFNDCYFTRCRFERCDCTEATWHSCILVETSLAGSEFGDAWNVNGLGIIEGDELDRLWDNKEIRLSLHEAGASVRTDDLALLQPFKAGDASQGTELVLHVFRKFFPSGSEREPRYRKVSTLSTSLPAHRKGEIPAVVDWLTSKGVLEEGPLLRGGGGGRSTIGITGAHRDEVKRLMREDKRSSYLKKLLAEAEAL